MSYTLRQDSGAESIIFSTLSCDVWDLWANVPQQMTSASENSPRVLESHDMKSHATPSTISYSGTPALSIVTSTRLVGLSFRWI